MARTRLSDHPQFEAIVQALRAGGSPTAIARTYGVNADTLRSWWKRHRDDTPTITVEAPDDELEAELDRALQIARAAKARGLKVGNINVSAGEKQTDGEWDGWQKESEEPGTAVSARQTSEKREQTRTAKVSVSLPDGDGPGVEIIQPARFNLKLPSRRPVPKTKDEGLRTAVIYPDAQIGWWLDEDSGWHTTHDEAALDLSLQFTRELADTEGVDRVVDLGDFGDWPQFSTHRSGSAYKVPGAGTRTNQTCARVLAQRTLATPDAESRDLIPGNHDARVERWASDNANQLDDMRAADQDHSILSLDYWYGVSAHGWTLAENYPQGVVWLDEHTRCIHGTIVRPTADQTNNAYLDEPVNTIYGHTHRAGLSRRYRPATRDKGPRTYFAGSPGCLCRVDGSVPSATGALRDGKPATHQGEKWQQGIFVVRYAVEGDMLPEVEHIMITDGKALWRGRRWYATVDADGNPLED